MTRHRASAAAADPAAAAEGPSNGRKGRKRLVNLAPLVVCPPDLDPVEFMVRTIEAEVHDAGWDGPNRLFFLGPEPGFPAPPDMGGISAWELPLLTHETVNKMHPVQILSLAAGMVERFGLPGPVFAVVLVMESWAVAMNPSADPAEVAQLRADREARQLHTRADRIETRMAYLIAVDGDREVVLSRQRNEEPTINVNGVQYSGDVPDALRQFAQVVNASTPGGGW